MLKLLHKVMLKILQARLQQDVNQEFPNVQAGFILFYFFLNFILFLNFT